MRLYFVVMILFFGVFVSMYGGRKIDTKRIIYLFNRTEHIVWATSELKQKGYNYSVKNLWDDDPRTFWATSVNGGQGEEIVMFFSAGGFAKRWKKGIGIINGSGKSENLFFKNNRAREIELTLYRGYVMIVMDERYPRQGILVNPVSPEEGKPLLELVCQTNLVLADQYLYTNKYYFDFEKDEKETVKRIKNLQLEKLPNTNVEDYDGYSGITYILVITVKSVYNGSKYNDLCISELLFLEDEK